DEEMGEALSPARARSRAVSLALKVRLPLLEEGRHALFHVRGRRGEAEHVGLDDLAFLLGHVEAAADRLDAGALRDRTLRQDRLRELVRALAQFLRREETVHDPDAPRFFGGDHVAGEHPLACDTGTRDARETLRAAVARDDAEAHLGQTELRRLRR